MAKRLDMLSRKLAINKWRAEQVASARASLPLPDDRMPSLFDMLDEQFPIQGCDQTLRLTRCWLAAEGLEVEPVVDWLRNNGGCCDCEALANAEERWKATQKSG